MTERRSAVLIVDGLRIQSPTATRKNYRIKGTFPNGLPCDRRANSRRDAEMLARQLVAENQPRSAKIKGATYGQALDDFLNPDNHDYWGKNGGSRHADDSASQIATHVRPLLSDIPCGELRPSDFRSVLKVMEKAGLAATTRQRVGASMRASVTFMQEEGYIEESSNPMRGVRYTVKKARKGEDGISSDYVAIEDRPSDEDVNRFADAMKEHGGERWWIATHFAAQAGPRYGELIYMTPSHFDPKTCTARIEYQWNEHSRKVVGGFNADGTQTDGMGMFVRALPKSGDARSISYPEWMNEYLVPLMADVEREHAEGKNPLRLMFCTKSCTIPRRSSWNRQVITPARISANWPFEWELAERVRDGEKKMVKVRNWRWSWHSLRHHAASLMISKDGYNLDNIEAAELLGHTLAVFEAKYVQPERNFHLRTAKAMAAFAAPIPA